MTALELLLLLIQVATTCFMTGLIWFVQIVHYPLFARVPEAEFASYENQHTRLTGWVVASPMVLEALSAAALWLLAPAALPSWFLGSSLGLLALIWGSTALLQVPCHQALSQGFDARQHRLLVASNWLRTWAWSLRTLLLLGMLQQLVVR